MTTREYHFRLLIIDDDRVLLLYPKGSEELHGRRAKAALEFLRDDDASRNYIAPTRSRELAQEPSKPGRYGAAKYPMCPSLVETLLEVATRSDPINRQMLADAKQWPIGSAGSRLSKLKSLGYMRNTSTTKRGSYMVTPAGHQWLKDHEGTM